jgi:tetratricopeptide (TPR) repeat protein
VANERRSLQERIRERQRSSFVGRQGQLVQYRENLGLSVDDERRRFLFNIHGNAGVGKTFLTRQLRQVASDAGALTAYLDETVEDVAAAMSTVAVGFSRAGVRLGEFEKRSEEYWQRRRELESDPQAPDGIAAFLTKAAVTIGLAAARDVPLAGSLLAPVDAAAAADQVNRAREYLARKFADHGVMRLLLSPAEELTPVFVAALNRVAPDRPVALFLDTYERTGLILDHWLRDLYAGRFGDLPETLVTTISGQKPLSPNLWSDYLPVIADVPLEPFSDAEARQFLASKDITDEDAVQVILSLSGRLPLWLATLADARPDNGSEIGDPTGDAVERFLRWEDDPEHRATAVAAALPRALNQDVLAVFVSPGKARELFAWLRELPFVSPRGDSWAYHEVVRSAMLRLRRAEAPATWRSQHELLAQANARWADQTAQGSKGDTWGNPAWIDYTREETYHLLCADPRGNLPGALASAVWAAGHSMNRARQWTQLFSDAGRDTRSDQLSAWGQRLADSIRDGELTLYFTCLINEPRLDKETLALALLERSRRHRTAGRTDQALTDLSHAIGLQPENIDLIRGRAQTYRAMGRYEDALADYSRVIDANPDDIAVGVRGWIYLDMGRYEDALADFNRTVELAPEYSDPFSFRAWTFQAMGRYEDALADYNRAIELLPGDAGLIADRGETYRAMGRYEDALADFNRAIELDPGKDDYAAKRAEIHQLTDTHDDPSPKSSSS